MTLGAEVSFGAGGHWLDLCTLRAAWLVAFLLAALVVLVIGLDGAGDEREGEAGKDDGLNHYFSGGKSGKRHCSDPVRVAATDQQIMGGHFNEHPDGLLLSFLNAVVNLFTFGDAVDDHLKA